MKKILSYKNKIFSLYLLAQLFAPIKNKYTIKISNDQKTLNEVFKLRYKIYCLVDKLLNAEDYPSGIEKDEFDDFSINFAAFDSENKAIGTLRLIKDSKLGFPTEKEFDLFNNLKNIPHDEMVEISRFLIDKNYRKGLLMLDLAKAIYLYSRDNNVNYWLGCAEEWFIKKINFLWGPIEIIGKPKFCFNAMNYPFILKLKDAEKNVKNKSNILLYYFNKKTKNFLF